MQAHRLPAARGIFWLSEGLRLFRRNPALIASLTLAYLLAVQLLALLLPGIGPILLPLLLPTLTLFAVNGCRLVDLNRHYDHAGLLFGIKGNLPALLRLGALQLAGALVVVALGTLIGGGNELLSGTEAPLPPADPAAAPGDHSADIAVQTAMLGALFQVLLLAAPVIIAFWFAPFLVGWDRVTPTKAVFFSIVAAWRNWSAMLMYGLGILAVAGILPGFLLILVNQVAGVAVGAAMVAVRMVLTFFVAPVLTASLYVSYRDIFHASVDTNA